MGHVLCSICKRSNNDSRDKFPNIDQTSKAAGKQQYQYSFHRQHQKRETVQRHRKISPQRCLLNMHCNPCSFCWAESTMMNLHPGRCIQNIDISRSKNLANSTWCCFLCSNQHIQVTCDRCRILCTVLTLVRSRRRCRLPPRHTHRGTPSRHRTGTCAAARRREDKTPTRPCRRRRGAPVASGGPPGPLVGPWR